MTKNAAIQAEWDQWRLLCRTLLAAGAVTTDDLDSPASKAPDTPGKLLLKRIRDWGSALVILESSR